MSVLSAKVVDGETVFTRIHGIKPRYNLTSHKYDYSEDDPVFETHRRRENWNAFRMIIRELKNIEEHAQNGFRTLFGYEQCDAIGDGKRQVENILGQGSFLPLERNYYIKKIHRRIYNIYKPFIKRRIKRLFN